MVRHPERMKLEVTAPILPGEDLELSTLMMLASTAIQLHMVSAPASLWYHNGPCITLILGALKRWQHAQLPILRLLWLVELAVSGRPEIKFLVTKVFLIPLLDVILSIPHLILMEKLGSIAGFIQRHLMAKSLKNMI